MSQLTLSFFGSPQIVVDGQKIEINRRKAVALLAYLAVTGQSHSRDALAAMLWPETGQGRARAALRSTLWELNKTAVKDWLLVEQETVSFRPSGSEETLEIDVDRFSDLLDAAQAHTHPPTEQCTNCLDLLTRAVVLYENDFMAGFTLPDAPDFDEWQYFEANSLRQKLATALESLIALHNAQEDFDRAIPYARRLVALDMLHEPAHRTLMQLYALAGQRSAALRQYEICRDTLDDEMGLAPSEETEVLYQRIRSGTWLMDVSKKEPAGAVDFASAIDGRRPKVENPNNLPPNPTPFIGREQEQTELAAFLGDQATRLLTIVGPGGIGKTRLALAAAADQVSKKHFPEGIYFVSLASLSDPENIVSAIAEAVGYPLQNDQRIPHQQLFDYFSHKTLLLVLDNLEHLLFEQQPDGAVFVADLLQHAPGLKVLATSRERLNLYEEQRFPLRGLAVDEKNGGDGGTGYAAAELFLQSARRRQPDFQVVPSDVPCLADICRLVEGMPLALELAASWLETLSLREIADEIQENLDFLATDVRNVPDRHRSMQAVFDASWGSLTDKEKEIYARLSVFRGGFTQDAARAIAGAAPQELRGLVNKSLLRFNQRRSRYEIHELLRQYAAEQLAGAAEETRDRHAVFFAAFLEQRDPDIKGARQREALAEIEADSENARAAFQWAAARSQVAQLDKAIASLAIFYRWHGRLREGEAMCRLAAEKLASPFLDEKNEVRTITWTPELAQQARVLIKALTWQGSFHLSLSHYDGARQALQPAQALIDASDLLLQENSSTEAFLLLQLSNLAIVEDFSGEAVALAERALRIYQAAGDYWGEALVLDALSQKYMNQGLHEKAFLLQEECLSICQRLNDLRGIARSYNILGLLVLHMGQIERSEAYLRESLALFRTLDNQADLSNPLAVLGINQLFGGKFEACIAAYDECWAIHNALSLAQEPFVADVTVTRAKVDLGRYEEARQQAEADLVRHRALNYSWKVAFTLFNLGRIDLAGGAASPALQRFQESANILQQMNERSLLPDVLFCLSYTYRALDDRQQAVQMVVEALRLVVETGPLNPMRFELPALALLLVDQGEIERAVEYYAAALQSPNIKNSRWFEDIAGRDIAEAAAALPEDVVAAAEKRGQERDLWLTVKEILAELPNLPLP